MGEETKATLRKKALNEGIIDITSEIEKAVLSSGIKNGICLVSSMHTTCGILVNENWDPDVKTDILASLSDIVPKSGAYRHAEGNSPAHIKAAFIGNSASVPVSEGKMVLGQWQGIMLCEFDGPRERKVSVSVVGK